MTSGGVLRVVHDHVTSTNPLRVVIADDDAEVRAALAEALGDDPRFDLVGVAVDAPGAVIACREMHPDVVVLDVAMPGGGAAAARAIRTGSPDTAIVALSARRDRTSVTEMLEAGASAYLSKSTTLDLAAELLALHSA